MVIFDENKVQRVKSELDQLNAAAVADMFKALADETRMKLLTHSVWKKKMSSRCRQRDGSSVATASHHLRLLRNMGLAKYRKEGKMVFYSLDDDHVTQLIQIAVEHSEER